MSVHLNTGDVAPAIHVSSTFRRHDDMTWGAANYCYGREKNPSRRALEVSLAELEGGSEAVAFGSGHGAASGFIQSLPRVHIILSENIYFAIRTLMRDVYVPWGASMEYVNVADLEAVRAAAQRAAEERPCFVMWLEFPTNPMVEICDVVALTKITHEAGGLVVVDSTWLSPAICRPFQLGVDFVLQSCTKYLGGHSDLILGAIICRKDPSPLAAATLKQLKAVQVLGGCVPAPFDCWLCARGMRSLSARMQLHCDNASAIASFLHTHPAVEQVLYPGHPSHPQHALAVRQALASCPPAPLPVDGSTPPKPRAQFGGVLSVKVKGGYQAAVKVSQRLRLFTRATSLGGTESLVEHRRSVEGPLTKTPDNLLRLSVGIEAVSDLIRDLDQALNSVL